MSRRFVYMVVNNCSTFPGSHTLHRINPSRLFYPKDSPERAVAAVAPAARATTMESVVAKARATRTELAQDTAHTEKARLPRPAMTFSSPSLGMHFALSGRSKDKIVAVDCNLDWFDPVRAVLYDDASHSIRALPCVALHLFETVPVAVGDDVFFMFLQLQEAAQNTEVRRALIRDRAGDGDWGWQSFPLPPGGHSKSVREMIAAYAVVDESRIWASTSVHGTHFMDTAAETRAWCKATDSPLPFQGRAEYAPELGLWFGFPNAGCGHWANETLLGAWDLQSTGAGGGAAAVEARGVWEGFMVPPESRCLQSRLLHLGDGGRFCVAKVFQMIKPPPASRCTHCYYDDSPPLMGFAVLTGVEVELCDSGELRMIKHRSCKYSLGENIFVRAVL